MWHRRKCGTLSTGARCRHPMNSPVSTGRRPQSTPVTVYRIEALGVCSRDEFGDWVGDRRRLGPGGDLPLSTAGGQLAEGRFHGISFLNEAVLQLRGQCTGPTGARRAGRDRRERLVPAVRRDGIDWGMTESPDMTEQRDAVTPIRPGDHDVSRAMPRRNTQKVSHLLATDLRRQILSGPRRQPAAAAGGRSHSTTADLARHAARGAENPRVAAAGRNQARPGRRRGGAQAGLGGCGPIRGAVVAVAQDNAGSFGRGPFGDRAAGCRTGRYPGSR